MTVALCHGTFDLLHVGHVLHFREARRITNCDVLVVTLTADQFIAKGPGRPIFNEDERLLMVQSLWVVDEAEICREKTGLSMIQKYKPNWYVKGGDYKTIDKHGSLEAERLEVQKHGGELLLTGHAGWSSSGLIERVAKWASVNEYMVR